MTTSVSSAPHISVCIVNFNTREDLRTCLRSVFDAAAGFPIEVIVVDNASSDGSPDMVVAEFPRARLLRNLENEGFAVASNQALRSRRGRYALLLNPDITVCEGAIQRLYAFMESRRDVGAATGKLVSPVGSFQRHYYLRLLPLWGWILELINGLTWSFAQQRMESWVLARFDPRQEASLNVVPGGCLMVRREVLDEVGLLDEDFFIWYEDTEWCWRMRRAGWELYFVPDATFLHVGGASFQSWSHPERSGQWLTSSLIFLDKQYSPLTMVLVRAVLVANFLVYLLAFAVGRWLRLPGAQRRFTVRDRLEWLRIVMLPPAALRRRRRWHPSG